VDLPFLAAQQLGPTSGTTQLNLYDQNGYLQRSSGISARISSSSQTVGGTYRLEITTTAATPQIASYQLGVTASTLLPATSGNTNIDALLAGTDHYLAHHGHHDGAARPDVQLQHVRAAYASDERRRCPSRG